MHSRRMHQTHSVAITKNMDALTLVCFSDTHTLHREIDMPAADLGLCAGDWTFLSRSMANLDDFNDWLGELPYPVIVCPGNHELYLQEDLSRRSMTSNSTLLINEGSEIMGLKIWASPVTPVGPAFRMRSAADRRKFWERIPGDTDILITHGPPYSILDCATGSTYQSGDPELLDAVKRVKPLIHIFGHVHRGTTATVALDSTLFINCALFNSLTGDLSGEPVVIRLPRT